MLNEIQVSLCTVYVFSNFGCNFYLPLSLLHFRELLADDDRFAVPAIVPELSTKRVLTAELINGLPLDHCTHLPQKTKNEVRMTSSI